MQTAVDSALDFVEKQKKRYNPTLGSSDTPFTGDELSDREASELPDKQWIVADLRREHDKNLCMMMLALGKAIALSDVRYEPHDICLVTIPTKSFENPDHKTAWQGAQYLKYLLRGYRLAFPHTSIVSNDIFGVLGEIASGWANYWGIDIKKDHYNYVMLPPSSALMDYPKRSVDAGLEMLRKMLGGSCLTINMTDHIEYSAACILASKHGHNSFFTLESFSNVRMISPVWKDELLGSKIERAGEYSSHYVRKNKHKTKRHDRLEDYYDREYMDYGYRGNYGTTYSWSPDIGAKWDPVKSCYMKDGKEFKSAIKLPPALV